MTVDQIKELILDVPDFPKPGVGFKDITPILETPHAFKALADHLVEIISPMKKEGDVLVAIESRGFLLACAVAPVLNMGVVLARKPGKLPRKTISQSYSLEYGEDRIEVHEGSLHSGMGAFIVDDVLATGGTAQAVENLIKKCSADVRACVFLMELGFLNGRNKLTSPIHSLIKY